MSHTVFTSNVLALKNRVAKYIYIGIFDTEVDRLSCANAVLCGEVEASQGHSYKFLNAADTA